jgi:hypothetical protein
VRLNTGELGVVLKVYAPDPYRPKVRVVIGADRQKLVRPYDINLWEADEATPGPTAVVSPVDPGTVAIDPLTYL